MFKKVLICIALFVISALIPGFVIGGVGFISSVIDRYPPEIVFEKPPSGIGLTSISIKFDVSDRLAGLGEVVVRSVEGHTSKVLFSKDYTSATERNAEGVIGDSDKVFDDTVVVPIAGGKESGYAEGDVSLVITAVDDSIFRNVVSSSLVLRVDYEMPRVVPLTESITGNAGGSVLVFYQVRDRNLGFHGVRLNSGLYPGFAAEKLDKAFSEFKDVYFTLFPVPVQCSGSACSPELLAVDQVGNQTAVYFEFNRKSSNATSRVIELNGPDFEYQVAELYQQYLKRARLSNNDPSFEINNQIERGVFRFQKVNGEYRAIIAEDMMTLFRSPKGTRYWQGAFLGLGAGKLISRFGDTQQFKVDGTNAGESIAEGTTWVEIKDDEVRAANSGVVIYAGQLGVYGNAIIIDHGFGLVSLYGYLDSLMCKEGDRVNKASVIAKVGHSGIAAQKSVYFEIRVHGVAVDPDQWWDEGWIKSNIERPLLVAKKKTGAAHIGDS